MVGQQVARTSIVYLAGIVLLLLLPMFLVLSIGISLENITPNDKFFVANKSGVPEINMSSWQLTVDGLVGNPVQLTYQDLKAMPSTNVTALLKCVQGYSGRAVWGGVQLSTVLDLVEPQVAATQVVFYAADDYSSSITIGEARADDVLLAYLMNGETLPKDQGFPLRLVAPSKEGYKWVQFIVRIEIIGEDYQGYWESRGWDQNGSLRPYSDWNVHAYLQSFAFMLGGLAMVSGARSASDESAFRRLPAFMNKRFHKYVSIIFLGTMVAVFIYWAITTFQFRGAVFYSSHGVLSAFMVGLMLFVGATGIRWFKKNVVRKVIHQGISLFAFVLFLGVILIGLILAGVASL
jgi:hypothetical protein